MVIVILTPILEDIPPTTNNHCLQPLFIIHHLIPPRLPSFSQILSPTEFHFFSCITVFWWFLDMLRSPKMFFPFQMFQPKGFVDPAKPVKSSSQWSSSGSQGLVPLVHFLFVSNRFSRLQILGGVCFFVFFFLNFFRLILNSIKHWKLLFVTFYFLVVQYSHTTMSIELHKFLIKGYLKRQWKPKKRY